MRAKKAKQLRAAARQFHVGQPVVAYEKVERAKIITLGELNEDGTRKQVKVVRTQVVLSPNCQRATYQTMKRLAA